MTKHTDVKTCMLCCCLDGTVTIKLRIVMLADELRSRKGLWAFNDLCTSFAMKFALDCSHTYTVPLFYKTVLPNVKQVLVGIRIVSHVSPACS